MTTTYPKQYVLDRIAARKASLESAQREEEGEAIALAEELDKARDVWAEKFRADLDQARTLLILNEADAKKAQEMAKNAGGPLPGHHPIGFTGENDTPEQALTRRKRNHERVSQHARRAAELDAIDHVTAYLQGTPVDEFTLTQLKTLGLLDFVKFDLARAKEQTR